MMAHYTAMGCVSSTKCGEERDRCEDDQPYGDERNEDTQETAVEVPLDRRRTIGFQPGRLFRNGGTRLVVQPNERHAGAANETHIADAERLVARGTIQSSAPTGMAAPSRGSINRRSVASFTVRRSMKRVLPSARQIMKR